MTKVMTTLGFEVDAAPHDLVDLYAQGLVASEAAPRPQRTGGRSEAAPVDRRGQDEPSGEQAGG